MRDSSWIGLDETELRQELYLYKRLQRNPPDSFLLKLWAYCLQSLRLSDLEVAVLLLSLYSLEQYSITQQTQHNRHVLLELWSLLYQETLYEWLEESYLKQIHKHRHSLPPLC